MPPVDQIASEGIPCQPAPNDQDLDSELGQAACYLAENMGWLVHPCKPDKTPFLKSWPERATTDLVTIAHWWQKWPDALIGVLTGPLSALAVVDIDDLDAFALWTKENGELPLTVTAETHRGRHLYYHYPEGESVRSARLPFGDLKAAGGYVIAPPSPHPEGSKYSWAPTLTPDDEDPTPLPSRFLNRSRAIRRPLPDHVFEGDRNNTLTSIAGSMRRRGASQAAIRAALLAENRERCDPPLSENEVARVASSVARYPPTMDHHLTDAGNGKRFVDHHRGRVLHCGPWGRWFLWDGVRWVEDRSGGVVELAKATSRTIYQEATNEVDSNRRKELAKWAVSSETRSRIESMLYMAQSEPGIPVLPEELDRDPWLITVANGTIDLRTGKLRESERSDLITKITPVVYSETAAAPTWKKVLERALPDPDVSRYVQKAAGYSVTGDVSEQALFFLYGTGANAKSTFLNALLHALGDFGRQASPDLLMFRYGNEHPTALADLRGRRLVTTVEVQEGRRMAEVMVKQLTGGDAITARRMREDFSSFKPTHKIWLAANHKPVIRGTDYAIWRRIRLIPFTVQIPEAEQDPTLSRSLEAEAAGILRWMVEGCLAWQREGLEPPAPVRCAVDEYRVEMDQVGQFIADRCDIDRTAVTRAGVLRKAYESWCEANGERAMSSTALGLRLQEKGLRRIRPRQGSAYEGISIREVGSDD